MSANNRFSDAITITPPLTASEIRQFAALYDWSDSFDAHLRIVEATEETGDGEVIRRTADAIVGPDETCSGYDVEEQIQALVTMFGSTHSFAGYIEVQWDPGYGLTPPSRYVVRDGEVVIIGAQIVWPMAEHAPVPMSAQALANVLEDMLNRVRKHDSFDGSISYTMSERDEDEYDVTGLYRYGNAEHGQGFMRMIRGGA